VTGGDGITRTLYQVEGSLHGVTGRFELIASLSAGGEVSGSGFIDMAPGLF
jgi:hypothetical protein